MHFLADENVSRRVVDGLRADGHDVVLVFEFLPGSSDDAVINAAQEQGRIVITEDTDFGELIIRRQLAVAGVVLLELDRLSVEAEARRVVETIGLHADQTMHDRISRAIEDDLVKNLKERINNTHPLTI